MLVSIIIPTYNRSEQLYLAIMSVCRQTYSNIEVLICDDGSNDGTEAMVAQLDDKRVIWLPGNHTGHPSGPRNRGIKQAKGDWIAFLDSDDIWHPHKLEEQLNIAKEHGAGLVCSNANFLDINRRSEVYLKNQISRELTLKDLLQNNLVITSSVLIKKEAIQSVGGFPEGGGIIVGEDYAVWLLCTISYKVYYSNEALCVYRDEPELSLRGKDRRTEFKKYSLVISYCIKIIYKKEIPLRFILPFLSYWLRRWRTLGN